jgi:hypothetical protein
MKKGKRIAVMIDLKRHGAVWEDLYDGLSSEEQKNEPRESLDSYKEILKKKGKISR